MNGEYYNEPQTYFLKANLHVLPFHRYLSTKPNPMQFSYQVPEKKTFTFISFKKHGKIFIQIKRFQKQQIRMNGEYYNEPQTYLISQ